MLPLAGPLKGRLAAPYEHCGFGEKNVAERLWQTWSEQTAFQSLRLVLQQTRRHARHGVSAHFSWARLT